MRFSISLVAVLAVCAMASAQNPPANGQPQQQGNPPPGGQPPKGQPGMPPGGQGQPGMPPGGQGQPGMPPGGQGQPGMPPGGQGQPGMPPGGQGQPGMPPGGQGQPGMPPGGPKGPAMDEKACKKQEPKVRRLADNCLKQKKFENRKKCFDKMEKNFPGGFFESCRMVLEPIKSEVMAKEKMAFPDQPSALEGGGDKGPQTAGGPNHGQPGQPGQPPHDNKPKIDCDKFVAKAKKEADQCIKPKGRDKRKACFDKIGQHIEKERAGEVCDPQLTAMKSEYQAKEKEKYPDQAPTLE